MKRSIEVRGKTATISSEAISIRVINNGGIAMFAASDILKACGVGEPRKWLANHRGVIAHAKMLFPIMTKAGARNVYMWFCTPEEGCYIINNTSCDNATKEFLLKQCFTYRFRDESLDDALDYTQYQNYLDELWENERARETDSQGKTLPPPQKVSGAESSTAIADAIDKVLVALLELKYQICAAK